MILVSFVKILARCSVTFLPVCLTDRLNDYMDDWISCLSVCPSNTVEVFVSVNHGCGGNTLNSVKNHKD